MSALPYLKEHRAAVRLAEADHLAETVGQIQRLDDIRRDIVHATSQWQTVQEQASQTVAVSQTTAQQVAAEARGFMEFLQKANDSERAHLRLEVEKLRRAEGDWLQVLTRVLDHVYALHQAGVRSGQAGLVDQLGQFQNACRDVARRVGLVAFAPPTGELFDTKLHQPAPADGPVLDGARISGTIAAGYTFQGQLLRRALVSVAMEPPPPEHAAGLEGDQ